MRLQLLGNPKNVTQLGHDVVLHHWATGPRDQQGMHRAPLTVLSLAVTGVLPEPDDDMGTHHRPGPGLIWVPWR